MSLELSVDQSHLARHKVGYDPATDTITFLPFVYSAEERVIPTAVFANSTTTCGTIEELFLRRSSNLAGVRVRNARAVFEIYQARTDPPRLTSLVFLECAEAYAKIQAGTDTDMNTRERELQRIRKALEREIIFVPDEVARLMAA